MKLLRYTTDEEHEKLKELSKREALQSDNQHNYYHADPQYINSPLKGDEDVAYINSVLKEIIEGFVSFSNFVQGKTNLIRIQYHWNENFVGVGYILIGELHNGFSVDERS